MTRPPQLRRLHFLNALFAPLTGHDLYLAQQIDDAIITSLDDAEQLTPADPRFISAAAQLFERLCSTDSQHGFFHWDASAEETGSSPLFARAGVGSSAWWAGNARCAGWSPGALIQGRPPDV